MDNDNNNQPYDGETARKKAVKRSEWSDMKQHANKLYQGFKRLNDTDTKRAIWELFQNAIDLSSQSEITIIENQDNLQFSHNGELFNSDTLISLIKQVSSKSVESNENEIGQYGTGFITTHSFGRKITVDSYMNEEGRIISLKNFTVDRTCEPNKPEQLIEKLIAQRDRVFDLVEKGDSATVYDQITKITYWPETEKQKGNIRTALSKLEGILPYVMIFNADLKIVNIKRLNEPCITYKKSAPVRKIDELYTVSILRNNESTNYYYLQSEIEEGQIEPELMIGLPVSEGYQVKELENELSRLFLYFPLIGTENFGFNFIIHSKEFKVTEPRDGLYLSSTSEDNFCDEQANQILLKKCSEMIFRYITANQENFVSPIYLAKINFQRTVTDLENENEQLLITYFNSLEKIWVNELKKIKLVDTAIAKIAPANAIFFHSELLEDKTEGAFDAIYKIALKFWSNLPLKNIAVEWTNIVNEWKEETVNYLTIALLLEKIQEEGSLTSFHDCEAELKIFYQYVIDLPRLDYFKTYNVIPNIDDQFINLLTARSPQNIDEEFIEVGKILIPDITGKFIREDFILSFKVESYTRENLNTDIKSKNTELTNQLSQNNILNDDDLKAILAYSSIFTQLNNRGVRGELVDLFIENYGFEIKNKQIQRIEENEIDFNATTRTLMRDAINRLRKLTGDELKTKLKFLHRIIELSYDTSAFGETMKALQAYPSQAYKLESLNNLSKQTNIPLKLKELYNKIVNNNKSDVRSTLLLEPFNDVVATTNIKTPKSLADEIYKVFTSKGKLLEIEGHAFEEDILDIIRLIPDDPEWSNYFPEINSDKELILMKKITEASIKDNLFKIIGSGKERIKLLSDISQRPDLAKLLEEGEKVIEREKRYNSDFLHKKTIGVHIETLIRKALGEQVNVKVDINNKHENPCLVDELQGGQDIVVYVNGLPFYYIEVKSRWDSGNSVYMSKLQLERAALNQTVYALCSVDMTKYKGLNKYKVEGINEIIEFIKFIDDIGVGIDPLIANNIKAEAAKDKITLTDYRGLIPQDIINSGDGFDDFITGLCRKINLKLGFSANVKDVSVA